METAFKTAGPKAYDYVIRKNCVTWGWITNASNDQNQHSWPLTVMLTHAEMYIPS